MLALLGLPVPRISGMAALELLLPAEHRSHPIARFAGRLRAVWPATPGIRTAGHSFGWKHALCTERRAIVAAAGVGACANNADVCAVLSADARLRAGAGDGAPPDGERGHVIPEPRPRRLVDG